MEPVVTVLAPRTGALVPSRLQGGGRLLAALLGCAIVDAVAVLLLLLPMPLETRQAAIVAGMAHWAAMFFLTRWARAPADRLWLAYALFAVIPCLGGAVAAVVLMTRGRGLVSVRRRRRARGSKPTHAAARKLGSALSPGDALGCGDDEQRHAAMSMLSRRGDPQAIAVLRWIAAGRDADLALSAALALDEIAQREERRARRPELEEVRYGIR